MFFRFFFFFFQAEDGIRDGTVTGVQTCALPISAFEDTILGLVARKRFERAGQHEGQAFERLGAGARSEERRVGKSVDRGGRRIIKKKKKKNRARGTTCSKEEMR